MSDHSTSGELLLASLADFVTRKESEILRGSLTLRLQPRALEYLSARLQILAEIDALRQSSPPEYFRGAFTDLDEYTRLHRIQQTLQRAQSVRIHPNVNHLRDPTRVNLSPFLCLKSLELVGCDLSTSSWVGLKSAEGIERLKCMGCLEELHHLLSPYSHLLSSPARGRTESLWPNLTSLVCTRNTFERMDSSLNLPALRVLELSNNNISSIQNLHLCSRLRSLNLSYNNVASLDPLRECTTTLQELKIQGNAIRSLKGLQGLVELTELDLRSNMIASYPEFNYLKELSALKYLWLEGNPVSYAPFYRLDVLAWFEASQLCLDGVMPKSSEAAAVAMRATGEVPLAWHIMAQYVSQQHLLWRPKEAMSSGTRLLWRTSSAGRHSSTKYSPHRPVSASRRSMQRRRPPARRIVEFTGDPMAALQTALERPPSPSPFNPGKDDGTESVSRNSSASGGRLPQLRSKDRMNQPTVHTTYRDCTASNGRHRPLSADSQTPRYRPSVIDESHQAGGLVVAQLSQDSGSLSSSLDTASSEALPESEAPIS